MPGKPRKLGTFSSLPPEIRVMIWNLSMEPRVISLKADEDLRWKTNGSGQTLLTKFRLRGGPAPAALGVNVEARAEALKRYIQVYSAVMSSPKVNNHQHSLYIDLNRDTIYIDRTLFLDLPAFRTRMRNIRHSPSRKRVTEVRHVAFPSYALTYFPSQHYLPITGDPIHAICMAQPGLETLRIVLDNSRFWLSKSPQRYRFVKPRELKLPDALWGAEGGAGGNSRKRKMAADKIATVFQGFRTLSPKVRGFLAAHPEWKEPQMEMVSLLKKRR